MRDSVVFLPETLPSQLKKELHGECSHTLKPKHAYNILFPLIALAFLPAIINRQLDLFQTVAIPFLFSLLLFAYVSAFFKNVSAQIINSTFLIGSWCYLLGHFIFKFTTSPQSIVNSNFGDLPWIVILFPAHIWLFGRHLGRQISLFTLVVLVILLAIFLIFSPELWKNPVISNLTQLILASTAIFFGQQAVLVKSVDNARKLAQFASHTSEIDVLTGLINRKGIEYVLQETALSQMNYLAVGVIEVDHLEALYDAHSVHFGSYMSAHLGRVIAETLHDEDLAGCLELGKFVVLLRVPDERAARAASERLRLRIASRPVTGVNLTASVGVAFYEGQGSHLELLERALQAIETIRKDGFNRILSAPLLQPEHSKSPNLPK